MNITVEPKSKPKISLITQNYGKEFQGPIRVLMTHFLDLFLSVRILNVCIVNFDV